MQKRVKNSPPIVNEGLSMAKKKNNSRSALEALETSNNSSGPSSEIPNDGTPKKNERRFMVCHEILDTEQNYLTILNVLINTFKKPLKAIIESEGERDLLQANELNVLFRKIEPLIQVHENILQNLRKQVSDWKNTNLIGKIWADSAFDLEKFYPPYINCYDEMLATLDLCDASRPKFHAFLKQAEAKKECQKNSIRDLLIRPVQRIPSVLLLLQELQKRTERNNPDYPWVKGAVELLKGVLDKTNESRRRTENYQHFLEICQDIEGLPIALITSEREFVQSIDVVVLNAGGILHKFKGKTIGLFLFNDFVEVAKCRVYSSELSRSSSNLNSSFSGGNTSGSGGTLPRQMSLSTLRRGASWKKDRHRYKHIKDYRFANFRSLEMEREYGVFIVKIRDEKADEMCFFYPTNGHTFEICVDFFENLIQRIKTTSTRDIVMEEVTKQQISLSIAAELRSTGTVRRTSQLRRSVSQLHLRLSRIPSMKKGALGNINE
uniref:DH domain-containing protein n=1 Tax=Globodera pallida TaxID=36090 RepID=A0A183CEN9_GLOPA